MVTRGRCTLEIRERPSHEPRRKDGHFFRCEIPLLLLFFLTETSETKDSFCEDTDAHCWRNIFMIFMGLRAVAQTQCNGKDTVAAITYLILDSYG